MHKTVYIFFIVVIMVSCSSEQAPESEKNQITFVENIKPVHVFPPLITTVAESHIVSQVHDALLRVNAVTMELQGELCESWIINTEQDKYTFYLRKNVFFHNDTCFHEQSDRKLTAYDVKYTFEKLLFYRQQNHLPSGLLTQIKGAKEYLSATGSENQVNEISGIQIIDSLTLSVQLIKPNPTFHYNLVDPYMAIMPKEGLAVYGENCRIGCGAFKFAKAQPLGDTIILLKNEEYYKNDIDGEQLPKIDELRIIYEKVPQKSLRMLQNGQIDFILSIHQEFVKDFVSGNIEMFQGRNPSLVLEQVEGHEGSEIFLLRNSRVTGISFNQANQLNLDLVSINPVKKSLE